jgi:hypothetical protein
MRLERKYVGHELDEGTAAIARSRLRDELKRKAAATTISGMIHPRSPQLDPRPSERVSAAGRAKEEAGRSKRDPFILDEIPLKEC